MDPLQQWKRMNNARKPQKKVPLIHENDQEQMIIKAEKFESLLLYFFLEIATQEGGL